MSGLAQWLFQNGISVAGYDKTSTPLTDRLRSLGIPIDFEFASLPNNTDLIVFTPAVKDHPALLHPIQGAEYIKRAELLANVIQGKKTLAVAGTHGKTSTASILAFLLHHLGASPTAFVGGWMLDFDANYVSGNGEFAVVEADEFDRSFLRLSPYAGAITSLDADHLDIYGDRLNMIKGYQQFYNQISGHGFCIINAAFDADIPAANGRKITVSASATGHSYEVVSRQIVSGYQKITVNRDGHTWFNFLLSQPGAHNAMNALFALAFIDQLGLDAHSAKAFLADYKGVQRRFQTLHKSDKYVAVLDYAHHPTEIDSAISAAREMYPNFRLAVFFQPHLYTRTRDFMGAFAQSLSRADEVFLTEIYPARELPIPGITSEVLLGGISTQVKSLVASSEVNSTLLKSIHSISTPTCLLILGAGDIDSQLPVLWP